MVEPKITFFDVPSPVLSSKTWGPHTWKARFVLNYKRIPYKTVWVSFPDVESTLSKLGAETSARMPDDPSKPYYTLPAILDESGDKPVIVIDSLAIAEYLDEKYPEFPVLPKTGKALEHAFEQYFDTILGPPSCISPLFLPRVIKFLDERSQEHFRRTREKWMGKKLEEMCPEGPVQDALWKQAEAAFSQLGAVIDKNGPQRTQWIAGGSEPTRADFVVAAHLIWMKAIDQEAWPKYIGKWDNGRWDAYLKQFDQWAVCIE